MLLDFQIIDISSDDISYNPDNVYDKEFVITFYGKTKEGLNVVCNVIGFEPYFYLRVPDSWDTNYLKIFLEKVIAEEVPEKQRYFWKTNYLRDKLEIQNNYNFYGYNYDVEYKRVAKYKFAKISFQSYGNMNKFINCIKRYHKNRINEIDELTLDPRIRSWFTQDHNCECAANLYESKVHPMLRFLHEKNINSCGWVKIDFKEDKLSDEDSKEFNVDFEILRLDKKKIKKIDNDSMAGFITASFDIECDSSHGDFPNPIKNFKQLAIDIYEEYFRQSMNGNPFSIQERFIKSCIGDAFLDEPKKVQKIYTSNGKYHNLDEIMEKIDEDFIEKFNESKVSTSKKRDEFMNEFTYILNQLKNEDGVKLEVRGDPVIQIGTVFHRYGEKECYERTMVIIGNEDKPDEDICDKIPGVKVYECKTEKDLLLKWKDVMLHNNPDLLTGYNIFGFDFNYINKRVEHLFPCRKDCKNECCDKCPKNEFYRLGKLMRNNESDRIMDIDQTKDSLGTTDNYKKYWGKKCKVTSKELSSSGLGDNVLKYISMDGRVVFDIQKEIQKNHSLDSYKLDNVSAHFMKGKILSKKQLIDKKEGHLTILKTSNIGNLKVNDYLTFQLTTKYGNLKYRDGMKFKIFKINHKSKNIIIHGTINVNKYGKDLIFYEWCLAKDDVSPQQIFDFHKHGGPSGRAKVAKYCIMDCELCIHLLLLLDLIPNNMGMANVSYVPLSYIFLRGQGVKINSLVTKVCSEKKTRIPTLIGIINISPYVKDTYNSNKNGMTKDTLRNMIIYDNYYRNITKNKEKFAEEKYELNGDITEEEDTLYINGDKVNKYKRYDFKDMKEDKEYLKGPYLINKAIHENYGKGSRKYGCESWRMDDIIDELMDPTINDGFEGAIVLEPEPGIYLDDPVSVLDYASLYPSSIIEKNISHETFICTQEEKDENPEKYEWMEEDKYEKIAYDDYVYEIIGKTTHKKKTDTVTTCYFSKPKDELGIIPTILGTLLEQRKLTRKRIKETDDEDKKKVLDGLQLAYKVTANSVYGQMGAKTSSISFKKLAACTTAIGRQRIYDAEKGVKEWAEDEGYNIPEVIYGDTDSVFVKFSRIHHESGELLEGKEALRYCIDSGVKAGEWITKHRMNHPQDLEYEKTFYPFILISKKRYTGDKYELDHEKPKERTSMGIVMKRRDNAAIVKYVFGNVIEIIMQQRSVDLAMEWLEKTLKEIKNGDISESMFIISKSLRGYYKNPEGIAHKVLADRMAERNPGDKPKPNDRIPYMYQEVDDKPIFLGYKKISKKVETDEIIKSGKNKGKHKTKNIKVNGEPKFKKKKILQGDRTEHPDFMREKGIKIDYNFYITNQIMNPVKQVLDLEKDEKETDKIFEEYTK